MKPWKEQFAESTARRSSEVAHDLKTPLNVAVLNLELARMKVRRIVDTDDDESISGYLKAVEGELRRIARIFDAYFVYVIPPGEEPPPLIDVAGPLKEAFGEHEIAIEPEPRAVRVGIHPERLRVLIASLVDGCRAVFDSFEVRGGDGEDGVRVTIEGVPRRSDEEVSKIFKFYYTDASGSPAFGLATARLITESYGGTLESRSEDGTIAIELMLPAGEE